jgi:hypothetical protein
MNRGPKTPFKEIFEHNNLTGSQVGEAFSYGHPLGSEFLILYHSHFDELVNGLCGGFGFLPLLGHHL